MKVTMRTNPHAWLLGFLLLLVLTSCTKTPDATEVLVEITSDLHVGEQLTRVDIEVYNANGQGPALQNASFMLASSSEELYRLPISFSVAPSSEHDTRDFRIVVTGFGSMSPGAEGSAIIEKQILAAFQPQRRVKLEIFLSQTCFDKLCRDAVGRRGDLTCNVAGECAAVPVENPTPVSAEDASAEDASGTNADTSVPAVTDAGMSQDTGLSLVDSAQPSPEAGVDSGSPLPGSACDATHACSAGYACQQETCVSKCLQTQCDPNATCSIVAGVPTCSCGSGFVQTTIGAGVVCSPVDCGTPTLTNGTATLTGATTTFGSGVRFVCNTGYMPTGASVGTCGADQAWSPKPTCSIVTCSPPLVAPPRGSISLTDGSNYGSVASYSCTNSTLQGDQNRTCQPSGAWSGSDPACLYCGDGRTFNEPCDPTAPGWSLWSCAPDCNKHTRYTPCSGNTETGGTNQGIGCDPGQVCFLGVCSSYPCVGDASCPGVPTGPTQPRCGSSLCIATACSSAADCAPGLTCYTTANPPYCVGCSDTIPCPADKVCNKYQNQTYGRCD